MRGRHGLDAPIECANEHIDRAAAPTCALGNHSNTCEHVSDAVVELGHEEVLALLRLLKLGDVLAHDEKYRPPFCDRYGAHSFSCPQDAPVSANLAKFVIGDCAGVLRTTGQLALCRLPVV